MSLIDPAFRHRPALCVAASLAAVTLVALMLAGSIAILLW